MKFTTKTVHAVGFRELEQAVEEFHGVPYSVVLAENAGNDSDHTATLDGSELYPWDEHDLSRWKNGGQDNYSPRLHVVMEPMVKAGVIPAGEWLINVSW